LLDPTKKIEGGGGVGVKVHVNFIRFRLAKEDSENWWMLHIHDV
jgi:hypothetical protein